MPQPTITLWNQKAAISLLPAAMLLIIAWHHPARAQGIEVDWAFGVIARQGNDQTLQPIYNEATLSTGDDLKQGVFTYFLLEGLKGKADVDNDGLVTVDEAFRFVSYHVPRATDQEQHPIIKGTVEGRLVLSVVR